MNAYTLFSQSSLGLIWAALTTTPRVDLRGTLIQILVLLCLILIARPLSLIIKKKVLHLDFIQQLTYPLTVFLCVNLCSKAFSIIHGRYSDIFMIAESISSAFLIVDALKVMIDKVIKLEQARGRLKKFFCFWFFAGAFLEITNLKHLIAAEFDQAAIGIANHRLSLCHVAHVFVILFISFLISSYIAGLFEQWVKQSKSVSGNAEEVVIHVSKAFIVGLALLIALPLSGIDITTIGVFGGALGIGIGLGLQAIASNYISGLILLIENKVRLGDVIAVNGFRGKVKQMSSRVTTIERSDGSVVYIPNSVVSSHSLENLTSDAQGNKISFQITLNHNVGVSEVKKAINQAIAQEKRVIRMDSSGASVDHISLEGITFSVSYWIHDIREDSSAIADHVLELVIRELRKSGIDFATYPKTMIETRGQ